MRRIILFIIEMMILPSVILAKPYMEPDKGYRGFAEIGRAQSINELSYIEKGYFGNLDEYATGRDGYFFISTTSGYQFNNHFFLGGGIKIGRSVEWDIPVFIDTRYDFKFNKITPFADFKIGYNIGKRGDSTGIFFSPSIGYRFNWGREVGLNIGVGFSFRDMVTDKTKTVAIPPTVTEDGIGIPPMDITEFDGTRRRLESYWHITIGIDF